MFSFFIRALHFKMSLSKAKRQHTDRTIKEKIEILGKLDSGVKAVDLCRQFNLSQSTLSTWKKQEMQTQRDGRCWESSPHKMQL